MSETMLQILRQGHWLATDFQHLEADTEWNEAAQHHCFQHSLKDSIKGELVGVEPLASVDSFISQLSILTHNLSQYCKRGVNYDSKPCWF